MFLFSIYLYAYYTSLNTIKTSFYHKIAIIFRTKHHILAFGPFPSHQIYQILNHSFLLY